MFWAENSAITAIIPVYLQWWGRGDPNPEPSFVTIRVA